MSHEFEVKLMNSEGLTAVFELSYYYWKKTYFTSCSN